jgi:4-amino-4-deoxy-L-arabinose transferase-like glycosyltransferase
MDIVGLRIFLFTILPLLAAGTQIGLDRSTYSRERRLEVFLLYLFALGVAGSGIGGFFAHFFLSDLVAESIGWTAGNPFQLEVAFANLALGILGIVAIGRRDGFREATVIAVTVFGVGATIVHLMDIVETGNLAPGNTLQNVGNLLKPALLIGFLTASRRAERTPDSEAHTASFEVWRGPRAQAAGMMTGVVATGFGVGFAVNQPFLGSTLGIILGAALVALIISRAPSETGGAPTTGRMS